MSRPLDLEQLDPVLTPLCSAPHWYVGFSGGVDSSALLHLVSNWAGAHTEAPPVTAIHINHCLQPQADDWENHCAWICRFLEVPFLARVAEVEVDGQGLEAAAREARYRIFETQLGAGDVLFLGHHQDDQAETFFLRLLRGAGVDGLAAMPASRPLGRGQVSRPLLEMPRSELENYVRTVGLKCIEDPSNEDAALDRNFLRQHVLPLIESRWPGYRQTVGRASEHLAGASQRIRQSVAALSTQRSAAGDPGFSAVELLSLDETDALLAVRNWLRDTGLQAPDQSSLEEFLRQLRDSHRNARPLLDCGSYRLGRHQQAIYLLPAKVDAPQTSYTLCPGEALEIPGIGRVSLERAQDEEGIWMAADEEFELSFRQGGERCHPVGRGRAGSLKKLLQESELPPWWRGRVPLLYLGDELLAVGGLWPCFSSRWGVEGHEAEAPWKLHWAPLIDAGFD